ncbi:cytochrome P450 [Rhypophila decipiens]|uniref:Cytochrome P450 n=1 Tax=Rhypophila decipiens TaxID=261697 RepID=A0AAN6Y4W4_9PEZI|nr:cytochrome P450 [Rhypophila decipiens]
MVIQALIVLSFVFVLYFAIRDKGKNKSNEKLHELPQLPETIPFISNACLQDETLVRCRLGPITVYFVAGESNVSALFRPSFTSEPWIMRIMAHGAGYEAQDLVKIAQDDSGVSKQPRPESRTNTRIWHDMHSVYKRTLINSASVGDFVQRFQRVFADRLGFFSPAVGVWDEDVRIRQFVRQHMAHAATHAVLGPLFLELNPGLMDAFWEYDRHFRSLAFGLPSWMSRPAVRARNRLSAMCRKWVEIADARFDWSSYKGSTDTDQSDLGWEPIFGSPLSRGMIQWGKSFGFSNGTMGAVFTLLPYGLHANTVPICSRMLMELIRDPSLWQAVREEVLRTETTTDGDDRDTKAGFDHKQLASLPLLTSIYTEALRLHEGTLVTRTALEPVTVGGHTFPKGAIFMTSQDAAHLDDEVWGTPEHPATEFWAYRHIKETAVEDENGTVTQQLIFSLAGPPGSFIPFGGGLYACSGRNMAKAEVLAVVANIVSNFEAELVEWLAENGSPADYSMVNGHKGEMKVRWRRVR